MTLTTIIDTITGLAQAVVPVLVSLAFLFFLWGLASFLLSAGDAEKQKVGKDRMLWGGVALFFIVSIGGLLTLLSQTFFCNPTSHTSSFSNCWGQFRNVQYPDSSGTSPQFPTTPNHSGGLLDTRDGAQSSGGGSGQNAGTLTGGGQNSGSEDQSFRFGSFGCFFGIGDCTRNDPDREGFPRVRGTVE